MVYSINIVISSIIGVIAVIIATISLLEGRKRTRLLETMIKTLPYTSKKRRPKTSSARKSDNEMAIRRAKEDDTRRMKLELEKERLQWKKNKDIAKGIAWIIDHLDNDEESEE